MKVQLTLFTSLFVILLGCAAPGSVSSQDKKPETQATPNDTKSSAQGKPVMKGLRDRVLTSSPEEIGLGPEYADAKVWGVLMEVAFPQAVATLLSLRDGTASLYISTGGGILGGLSAQKEAKRFVEEAEKHLASMKPTKTFPYPESGHIAFYVLTRDGVYSYEGPEKEITSGRHALSPLFSAGNDVLTGLRLASERKNPD